MSNLRESLVEKPSDSITTMVEALLKRRETVTSLSEMLGITERQFNRTYQKPRRALLTKDLYVSLRLAGHNDADIAHAYGYTRQSIWLKKKEWGLKISREKTTSMKSSHFRMGKPQIETQWGPAYEYRRGYYLIRFKKVSPYYDHPIAPHHQCLLHRMIVYEQLLQDDPHSEFLVPQNEHITLHKDCQIHHVNGDTSDNRIENLHIDWRKHHIRKHWHGAQELKQSFLTALEGRQSLSREEILNILNDHFE